jgi:hypothetical protein
MQPPNNNFHVSVTFYRFYFIIQQSPEHCNLHLLLSCYFNNFSKAQGLSLSEDDAYVLKHVGVLIQNISNKYMVCICWSG